MDLILGSHVREHGQRVGRLAGIEIDPVGCRITRIIFSRDGNLGPHAMTRALSAVAVTASGIELRDVPAPPLPVIADVVLFSRATRITRGGAERGRLVAVAVDPVTDLLQSIAGRQHWFTGKFTIQRAALDCSQPGEIRITGESHDTRAA
jgi:hypothetical protein